MTVLVGSTRLVQAPRHGTVWWTFNPGKHG